MADINPKAWIDQIFEAQQANQGGIVRRDVDDVAKFASFDALIAEVKRRDFHLVETGNQYVVICNSGALKIHC